jgi:sirohydrochlorin cobaltochelatase
MRAAGALTATGSSVSPTAPAHGIIRRVKPTHSVILFAHGARDARWSASLQALAVAISNKLGGARVRAAFLEIQSPTLPQALQSAASDGAREIHIVPVFWAAAGHVDNELPPMVADFTQQNPGISVRTLPVLSELPGMLDFIAGTVAQGARVPPEPGVGA